MIAAGRPFPTLTSAQVAAVDKLAVERFGIPMEWLMEAAGWQVARFCRGRTVVLCGHGSNAGDGLAAARHLHRWGWLQAIAALDRQGLTGPAARQAAALEAAGVEIGREPRLEGAEVLVDAMFGTGLNRAPERLAMDWIEMINAAPARVVAVDLPSGLRADDGRAFPSTVRADLTVTLGLPKTGLLAGDGPAFAGDVWLVDIGIPPDAYAMVGAAMPAGLFAHDDRLALAGLLS